MSAELYKPFIIRKLLETGKLNSTLIRAAAAAPFSDKGISQSVSRRVSVWADSGTVSETGRERSRRFRCSLLVNLKCAPYFPQLTPCSTDWPSQKRTVNGTNSMILETFTYLWNQDEIVFVYSPYSSWPRRGIQFLQPSPSRQYLAMYSLRTQDGPQDMERN